jgi:hypothetical protein
MFAGSGLDCADNCLFDVDEDGVCDQSEITGCLDDSACNYSALATDSCYCAHPDSGYDCNEECIADADADGICDAFEVDGCTQPSASNYNFEATEDDGCCISPMLGCTYSDACNFNEMASIADGTCYYTCIGCMDDDAFNFDSEATIGSGLCFFCNQDEGLEPGSCFGDLNSDGIRGTADLLMFLSYFGVQCEE